MKANPTVGHVGLVPSRNTFTGGFKAVGKTAAGALAMLNEVRAYEAAGAFAVEIEVVPVEVATAISQRVDILLTHDVSGPGTIGVFKREFGEKARVWDAERVVIIPDHYIFTEDEKAHRNVDTLRAFAAEQNLPHFYDVATPNYKGVCHVYVDQTADPEMALGIAENAKCQRPGVCNAIEPLLVHEAIAPTFLPELATRLGALEVELRGDDAARAIVADMKPATECDWFEEYLDLILAVRVVGSVQEAVDHINTYGSRHSDAIVSDNAAAQKEFLRDVDSSTVYVNASTRFTDGAEFGLGAEIGISTDKLHARGPMGLEELTTYKYLVYGKGQIRP